MQKRKAWEYQRLPDPLAVPGGCMLIAMQPSPTNLVEPQVTAWTSACASLYGGVGKNLAERRGNFISRGDICVMLACEEMYKLALESACTVRMHAEHPCMGKLSLQRMQVASLNSCLLLCAAAQTQKRVSTPWPDAGRPQPLCHHQSRCLVRLQRPADRGCGAAQQACGSHPEHRRRFPELAKHPRNGWCALSSTSLGSQLGPGGRHRLPASSACN